VDSRSLSAASCCLFDRNSNLIRRDATNPCQVVHVHEIARTANALTESAQQCP